MGDGPNDRGASRRHLIRACEASLKRLRTDVIDLYQIHEWDGLTPLEETMEALDSLVRAGKVRYIGCSNFSGWHMMKAMEIARREPHPVRLGADSLHAAGARGGIRASAVAIDQKLGVLVWSPIAGGLLSGKHRRNKARPRAPASSPAGPSRRCATRTRYGGSSTKSSRSARRAASRARRSRWRGCSAGRRSPR